MNEVVVIGIGGIDLLFSIPFEDEELSRFSCICSICKTGEDGTYSIKWF
jgi:hypothetical protein